MPADRRIVLVVEEEPILLDILAFRLELLGYEVETRMTAAAAFTWLAAQSPDLIAVGNVADMEPVEFLNRISDDPRTSETPLLLLSADSDLDAVQRPPYNAGADEYLLTPFDPLMLEKVDGLLALKAKP